MRDQFGTPEIPDFAASANMLGDTFDLVRGFIRRHWTLIALFTLPGVVLGAAVVGLVPWKYQAAATMLIDKQRLHFFQQQSVVGDLAIDTNAAIEGQLEVLKSDAIAVSVIKKLQLERDPEFAIAEPADGLFSALNSHRPAPLTDAQRERHHLDVFAGLRTVKRIGPSFAIEVGFQSHSPARAAEVANAIAEAYISDMWSSRRIANQNAVAWLQDRLSELRTQTTESENAVVDYRAKNGIIDTGGKLIHSQQIAEISSQLTQARSQLSDASARLNRARAVAGEYATSTVKPAMIETLNNSLTNKLLEQYLELSNRAAEYAERFGADHKATQKLYQRLEEAKIGLLNEMERLSQSFLSEKTILEKRVQDLEASLGMAVANSRTSEQAQVRLHELESIAQSYRTLYDSFLRRHSEAVLQQEQPTTLARVISQASEPLSKNMKKPLLFAVVIAFGSMGLGVGLSFLRDLRDRTFRTSDDIEQRLKSDFIGMIPRWEPGPALAPALLERNITVGADNDADRHVRRSNSVFWGVTLSPVSPFAEGIGRVKFSIFREVGMKDDGIVGFTSVLPSEGASTAAAGVAQSMARSGRSVILVDCDLRHPALTRAFAPHAKCGLQEILRGRATLDDAILTDPQSGFAFLPGVVDVLRARPEELLEGDALASVLRELRHRYEFVIVDLPPLFPMLDVAMTDRLINWYVVVVQWGSSKIDTVAHALARCPSVRDRMLGFALNNVDMRRLSLYDHRTAEYYDPKRYANYLLPALPDYHTERGHSENGHLLPPAQSG
jgi:succinoglycan biosynthesis transport protein ExoP